MKKNKSIKIVTLFLLTLCLVYYSTFETHVNSEWQNVLRFIGLVGLFCASYLIAEVVTPKLFTKNLDKESEKEMGKEKVVATVIFIFFLFLFLFIIESFKDFHFNNYGAVKVARMIDDQYYTFDLNGNRAYGQVLDESLGKQKNDTILILYSVKNPIINEPLNKVD